MAHKTLLTQDFIDRLSIDLTCPAGASVGDLVYVSATNTVDLTDASDPAKVSVVGHVSVKVQTTTCQISTSLGPITGATGLTVGDPVYLSGTTPGGVTSTAPATAVQVGVAISTTSWIFIPASGGSGGSNLAKETFTPALDQTEFTLSASPGGETLLFVNGVQYYESRDFTISGTTLTWLPLVVGFGLGPDDDMDVYYET